MREEKEKPKKYFLKNFREDYRFPLWYLPF